MLVLEINGRPVQPPVAPVVVSSRVLLAGRAVFEALGATVDFDAGTGRINVRRGLHFLTVTAGSRRAFVDNRPVALDVPPQISNGVTLLPLRFVAESLGGRVRYLARRDVLDIEDSEAPGSSPSRVLRHTFRPLQHYGSTPATVDFRRPEPGEFVTGGFPSISAVFRTHGGPKADMSTARMLLDGQDVTANLYVVDGAVGYTPGVGLAPGLHQVAVRVLDTTGRPIFSAWNFAVVAVSPGAPPGVVGYQTPEFSANGTQINGPGGSLQLVLVAAAGGGGYVTLCGYSRQYPLVQGNDAFHYFANVAPPNGLFAPACQAAAFFSDRNGTTNYFTLATPLRIDTRPP
jgi:hypothetical protein